MNYPADILLTIGALLLLGLVANILGRRSSVPRVTLMLLFGIVIGPEVLDLVPVSVVAQFEVIATITLVLMGLVLGGKLSHSLEGFVAPLFSISLTAAIGTALLVSIGLILIGTNLFVAIMLGCIASATDPAAIIDTIEEGGYQGEFPNLLMGIVALDDAWALIIFSIGLAVVQALAATGGASESVVFALHDIGGAVLLGVVLGVPAAYVTGRLLPGNPLLTEAVGLALVCSGLAMKFEVSFLIAAMTMGLTIARLASHHERAFHEVEHIERPFLIVFFLLAGASLDLTSLKSIGLIGLVYVLLRGIGKVAGAGLGALIVKTDKGTRDWMGLALLPQAGAATGMALVASAHFPEHRQLMLSIVISSTVLFELIGPVLSKISLKKTSELA